MFPPEVCLHVTRRGVEVVQIDLISLLVSVGLLHHFKLVQVLHQLRLQCSALFILLPKSHVISSILFAQRTKYSSAGFSLLLMLLFGGNSVIGSVVSNQTLRDVVDQCHLHAFVVVNLGHSTQSQCEEGNTRRVVPHRFNYLLREISKPACPLDLLHETTERAEMIQGKHNKFIGPMYSRQNQGLFPFSAYTIKSYSTQAARPPQKGEEYITILEIGHKKLNCNPEESSFRKTQSLLVSSEMRVGHLERLIKRPIDRPIDRPLDKRIDKPLDRRIDRPLERLNRSMAKAPRKVRATEKAEVIASLRYQWVTLYSLLGRREQFMSSLKGRRMDPPLLPLKPIEIQQTFAKYQDARGRDKGRVKFNYITSEQLRSIKYTPKPLAHPHTKKGDKVQYDNEDEDDNDEEEEEKQEVMDYPSWRRKNGVGYNQRVFIIKGGYAQLRKSLLEKGWFQNEDVWSPYYDFKWTTRICDIYFMNLKHTQGVNHFNNNHHLTSKYGLTRRLRTLALNHSIDSDRFYPKCYDLADQTDFQNFIQHFKITFAESVMKRFVVDKQRYRGLQLKIRTAYDVLQRRTVSFTNLVQNINRGKLPSIGVEEWAVITETADPEGVSTLLEEARKANKSDYPAVVTPEEYENEYYARLNEKVKQSLGRLKSSDPQFEMNGMRNVWIAKPNFMSRGRGIRCFNNIYDIADYCLGQNCQFVVQKYIENPLLVEGRKFDIRQWVLVQDFNPPKIWFYEECYIRFCADEYSLDNIYNRFMHLTNNSVQKHSKKHVADKSMWTMREFADFIGAEKWAVLQEKIKNIVVWSIKACQGSLIGKKGSLELFGYDFMIDAELNPWLIEVNMSPSMDYSTPVTQRLVKLVLQDTAKILNGAKHKGLFSCIYRGDGDLPKYSAYNI